MNNMIKSVFRCLTTNVVQTRNICSNIIRKNNNYLTNSLNKLFNFPPHANLFKRIPQTQHIVDQQQIREFKTKMRLRKRCRSCVFEWKNGRIYVDCKTYPSHKQHHLFSLEQGYDNLAHGYHINLKRKMPRRR